MSAASDIFIARIIAEEGSRIYAYDDATGLRVKAPQGNLTWGYGFNIDACGSAALFSAMAQFLVSSIERQIETFPWYGQADVTRQSVFLDIAYNGGVAGLLRYPKMLAAASAGNWLIAAQECAVSDVSLNASRYAPLRALLLQGDPA